MKKAVSALTAILIFAGFVAYCRWDYANPFDDIVFVKDYPGATERYVTFTPYLKSNMSAPICDEPLGADFGRLSFMDTDGDGIHEAVVETRARGFDTVEFFSPYRVVGKLIDVDGQPRIKVIESGPITSKFSGPQ